MQCEIVFPIPPESHPLVRLTPYQYDLTAESGYRVITVQGSVVSSQLTGETQASPLSPPSLPPHPDAVNEPIAGT
jgi:hypothetical protein